MKILLVDDQPEIKLKYEIHHPSFVEVKSGREKRRERRKSERKNNIEKK
jgi:hypothetical protein